MRFIFHFLGILFFLIWIVIGAALLVGLLVLFTAKPWQAVSGMMSGGGLGGLSALMGQAGEMGDLVKKMSSGQDIKQGFAALPTSQQNCLYQELGNKTVNDALAGKIQPTPDLVFKAMKCLK